jgi:hypothetical protein
MTISMSMSMSMFLTQHEHEYGHETEPRQEPDQDPEWEPEIYLRNNLLTSSIGDFPILGRREITIDLNIGIV